jgi:hypothetical protein
MVQGAGRLTHKVVHTSDLVDASQPRAGKDGAVLDKPPQSIINRYSATQPQTASAPLLTDASVSEAAPESRLISTPKTLAAQSKAIDELAAKIGRARSDLQQLRPIRPAGGPPESSWLPRAEAGARGGVRFATTAEYGALLALRDQAKVKPARPVPPPVADVSVQAEPPSAAAERSQGVALLDATEDQTEAKLLLWEGVASMADMAADVYIMINGAPDSANALGAEFIGSVFSLAPELVTLYSRVKESRDGKAIGDHARDLIAKVDTLSKTLRETVPADYAGLQQRKDLIEKLAKIKSGLELSANYGQRVVDHARSELRAVGLAVAGGGVELVGNAATVVAEAGIVGGQVGGIVGGVGAGVMGVAGLLAVPFQAKMMNEAFGRAQSDEVQARKAGQILSSSTAPKRFDRARSDESSGVRRGLAKFVERSSTPRENRFKAFLFGLGLTSSAAGVATSGLMAASFAGAAVGGAIATVGLVASGLGVLGVALLGGYFIYKLVSKDRSYSKAELKSIVSGERGSPLLTELQSRQQTKVHNQLTAEMIRQSLKHDEPIRSLLRTALDQYEKDDFASLKETKSQLRSEVASRLQSLNLPDSLRERLVGSITEGLVEDISAAIWVQAISNPELDKNSEMDLRFQARINMTLVDLLAEVDKLHTPLQAFGEWGAAMKVLLKDGSAARAGLLQRLQAELPMPEEQIGQLVQQALEGEEGKAGEALSDIIKQAAPDMARMSAMRKLIRRDPEALFYTCVDTLQRTPIDSDEHRRLKNDLIGFGVKEETLDQAMNAQTVEQMIQAAGLLARDIEGR